MVLIYIKMYNHSANIMTFEASPEEKIGELKKRIIKRHEELFKIPVRLLNLYTADRMVPLQDEKLVRSYTMGKAFFAGMSYLAYDIEVKVVMQNGENKVYSCSPSDTVASLKQKIVNTVQQGLTLNEVELVYYGRRLHNHEILNAAHVEHNSTIAMAVVKDLSKDKYLPYTSKKFDTSKVFLQTSHLDQSQYIPKTQSLVRLDFNESQLGEQNRSSYKPLFAYSGEIGANQSPQIGANPSAIVGSNLFTKNGLSSLGTGQFYKPKATTESDVFGMGAKPKPYQEKTKVRMIGLSPQAILNQNDTYLKYNYDKDVRSVVHENEEGGYF